MIFVLKQPEYIRLFFYFLEMSKQKTKSKLFFFITVFSVLLFFPNIVFAQKSIIPLKRCADTSIPKQYLIGTFDPSSDTGFIQIDNKYVPKGKIFYLRKEVYNAFLRMYRAALKDSVKLKIVSATRNFDYQKQLWEEKWKGETPLNNEDLSKYDSSAKVKMLLKYISMPGTSRHHWGTDIDLNSGDFDYFFTDEGDKFYTWMKKNAHKFGFCQPYIFYQRYNPFSVQEEKWHWSYLPLAHCFFENYKNKIKYTDINGFNGSELAPLLDVFTNYVKNINIDCY